MEAILQDVRAALRTFVKSPWFSAVAGRLLGDTEPQARDEAPVSSQRPRAAGELVAGRYRLDRVLGEGGMGVVWAATDTVSERPIALKFVKGAAVSAEARRRFLREARAVSAVRHPGVVEVHGILELDGSVPVMVMELLDGEPLAARLEREIRMSLGETASILLPIVSAVGTVHAHGIIHRDLKPENIFLVKGGAERAKVLDFGAAKLLSLSGDAVLSGCLTASGAMLGTPCYMAPEQVFGEREIDHRADIWALGLILYECLSGVLPTRAENIGQVLKIIVTGQIPPLAAIVDDVPADVSNMVDRMLSRDREARPADLAEVLRVLVPYASLPGQRAT